MTEVAAKQIVYPRVMHEGKYRLYEKSDGTLHLVYKPNGAENEEHMEIPGALIALAKQAENGSMSPIDMMKMAAQVMGGGGLFGG
jgi:hypothetical protein